MATEVDFTVRGVHYRASKLNAFQQFHVARRVAPLMAEFAGVMKKIQDMGGVAALRDDAGFNPALILDLLTPVITILGKMSDDDTDYVIGAFLGVTRRQIEGGKGWAAVVTSNGVMMYEDMNDMMVIGEIIVNVAQVSFAGFFDDLLSLSAEMAGGVSNQSADGSTSQMEKTSSSGPSSTVAAGTKA